MHCLVMLPDSSTKPRELQPLGNGKLHDPQHAHGAGIGFCLAPGKVRQITPSRPRWELLLTFCPERTGNILCCTGRRYWKAPLEPEHVSSSCGSHAIAFLT
ncbi:adenosine deaminase-like protein-like protein [Anopheles sinensis]|uniref:Adenosine deaminase-like protein-like protein n=1 Tax=Anopheles sinensis TaxID=74873 RepID=A0A084WTR4_ANOSI|nr:adenosine deaminase-like protein-like protein [Anopheles sinensis]